MTINSAHPVVGPECIDHSRRGVDCDLHQGTSLVDGPHRAGGVDDDDEVFR